MCSPNLFLLACIAFLSFLRSETQCAITITNEAIYFSKSITAFDFLLYSFDGASARDLYHDFKLRYQNATALLNNTVSHTSPEFFNQKIKLPTVFPPETYDLCENPAFGKAGVVFDGRCYLLDPSAFSGITPPLKSLADAQTFCQGLAPENGQSWVLGLISSSQENRFIKAFMRYLRIDKYLLDYQQGGTWSPVGSWTPTLNYHQFVQAGGAAEDYPSSPEGNFIYVGSKGWGTHDDTTPMDFYCVRDL